MDPSILGLNSRMKIANKLMDMIADIKGHGIILGSRSQKRSFGFINQDYGIGVIEVVFP